RVARGFLIVVSVLNGAAGVVCGVLFLAGPDGHLMQAGALLPVVQRLPLASVFFRDFTWIGIAMLLVLGIPNSIAAVMLLRRSESQYLATLTAGVLLVLWCGFELIFMFSALAVGYFAVGLVSILSSIVLLRELTSATVSAPE
ncbi:MAG: hypothetical protein U1E29_00600, partial [Coriobacteriia bacterium]|nr:hypothetical protein [Coriobacteriia bacterium]